jgi:hypothetical protein
MPKLPQKLKPVGYKSEEREAINQIIDFLQASRIVSGKGIVIKEGPGGITVAADPNYQNEGGNAEPVWL